MRAQPYFPHPPDEHPGTPSLDCCFTLPIRRETPPSWKSPGVYFHFFCALAFSAPPVEECGVWSYDSESASGATVKMDAKLGIIPSPIPYNV